MDNEEHFYIPENTGETRRALKAKKDFLSIGPGRSLDKLLAMYQEQKRNRPGSNPPSTNRSTVADWSRKWGWIELAARYDDHQADRLLEQEFEERKQQYLDQIQQFADFNKASGKAAFKTAATAVRQLLGFIETAEGKGQGIKSWDDAVKVANIVRGIQPLAELWAKSLCISRLLDTKQFPWED